MLTITFDTDNAAYRIEANDPDTDGLLNGPAVGETVHGIADRLERGETAGKVRDFNGNTVGSWSLTD